jgi:hypothetical protein
VCRVDRRARRRWNTAAVHGMNTPVNRTVRAFLWLALVVAGCSHDIGDNCMTSVDCDPTGTRSCDLSQPGGYCTIAGCDETSCPSGSTCVRTFPPLAYLTKMCNPQCEDLDCAPPMKRTDDCLADEICLDAGYCVKQSYEQRYCAKVCSSNGDCRGGYECRKTGEKGSMALATNPLATTSFCAPYVP